MRVIVQFCMDADVIDCPEFVVNNLKVYASQFEEWFRDKKNNHAYWEYQDGEQRLRSYRSEAFVEWLNKFILGTHEEKARVLMQGVDYDGMLFKIEYPREIAPIIYEKGKEYVKWMRDTNSENISRQEEYQKKYGERKYREYAQADWINSYILKDKDEKAYVIDDDLDFDETKVFPKIYF